MAAIRTKFIDKASASVPQYRDTSAKLLKKLSERGFAVLRLEDPDTAALKNLFTEAATFLGKPAFDKEAHSADPDDDDQQLADAGCTILEPPAAPASTHHLTPTSHPLTTHSPPTHTTHTHHLPWPPRHPL